MHFLKEIRNIIKTDFGLTPNLDYMASQGENLFFVFNVRRKFSKTHVNAKYFVAKVNAKKEIFFSEAGCMAHNDLPPTVIDVNDSELVFDDSNSNTAIIPSVIRRLMQVPKEELSGHDYSDALKNIQEDPNNNLDNYLDYIEATTKTLSLNFKKYK